MEGGGGLAAEFGGFVARTEPLGAEVAVAEAGQQPVAIGDQVEQPRVVGRQQLLAEEPHRVHATQMLQPVTDQRRIAFFRFHCRFTAAPVADVSVERLD